jgi:hypothetical protein
MEEKRKESLENEKKPIKTMIEKRRKDMKKNSLVI